MIFDSHKPRVAELLSRHDFILDALPADGSGGLPLGNGDLSGVLFGGPDVLALDMRRRGLSCGQIRLRTGSQEAPVQNPSRTRLRLYDATARIGLSGGAEVEVFVAATRSLVVLRLRPRERRLLSAALELACPGPASQFRSDGPFRYARSGVPEGLDPVMCGFVYGARSQAAVRGDALRATFDVPPSGECVLLIGIASSPESPDPVRSARTEVERALPPGYLLLQREHAVWWEKFWSGSDSRAEDAPDYAGRYRRQATYHEPTLSSTI